MKVIDFFGRRNDDLTEEEEFIRTIETHKRNKKIRRLLIALIFVISVISIVVYYKVRKFKDIKVKSSIEITDGAESKYVKYGDMLVKYSEDGISYIGKKKIIWNYAFEMKEPLVDTCGEYVVAAQQGGTEIYLFNKSGLVKQMQSSYPIVKVDVAKQGVVACILEDEDTNYIEITDKDGNKLVAGRTELSSNGYPLDFAISEDGKKMVVSYLYVSSGVVQSKVLFYNFSDVGQNEVDRMVGGFNQYAQSVVPFVRFLTNDVAVCVADDRITLYSMKQKPSIISEEEFDEEIENICYSNEYVGVLLKNSSEQHKEDHRLVVYNLKGKEVMSLYTDELYENIDITDDYIYTYDDVNFKLLTFSGNARIDYAFKETVTDILQVNYRTYFVVMDDKVEYITLK